MVSEGEAPWNCKLLQIITIFRQSSNCFSLVLDQARIGEPDPLESAKNVKKFYSSICSVSLMESVYISHPAFNHGIGIASTPPRYVARCRSDLTLYGSNFNQEGDIDVWLEFALHEAGVTKWTRSGHEVSERDQRTTERSSRTF